ncbi:orexin receptor type 2-like [Ostrinia furnacalis]|uniref:orexin receptor type 2-like n=1 Tax=Ostrinia furnacalis TaxID=93504 RepID=UPI00103FAFBF|nr:orexin receptor type 2-like [Ostrinia furnacalis]
MEDYNETLEMMLNASENYQYQPYYLRPETYIVPLIFALIFIIGVVGNGTLVAVFVRHKAMRNVPNTYILSLALADLLVIITCVPFTSIVYTVESWPWGDTVCRVSEAAKDVSIGVSVFTLTALSADRYFAIVDPLRKLHATGGSKRATRVTVATAVGIWILAGLLATPAYVGSYLRAFVVNPTTQFLVCYPYPPEWGENYPRTMVLIRFLVYYSLPLAVIALFYVLMARHLVLSTQNVPGEMQGTQRQGAAVTDGRLRAGDRLVSVNKVSVAGLTQQQVVSLLRTTPTDSTVEIVVERNAPHRTQRVEPQQSPQKYIEKAIGSPNTVNSIEVKSENGRVSSIVNAINQNNSSMRGRIPKSSSKDDLLKENDNAIQDTLNSSSNSVLGPRNRLVLRLDVPVHDSEKAGLGISVKGKVTVGPDPQDLGIFIKSVLHGGAASRDGRLHTNDQLLSVNGVSLVGQSNAEAMETLRRALIHSRPHVRGSISLSIARRTGK